MPFKYISNDEFKRYIIFAKTRKLLSHNKFTEFSKTFVFSTLLTSILVHLSPRELLQLLLNKLESKRKILFITRFCYCLHELGKIIFHFS